MSFEANLEVEVRPGNPSGAAHRPNEVSRLHSLPLSNPQNMAVGVHGRNADIQAPANDDVASVFIQM